MAEETKVSITTHAEGSFDPALYASLYYNTDSQNTTVIEATAWFLNWLHRTFETGKLHGKRLLDVGTGPVVHPVIPAAAWYDEIYLSDLWEQNIEYLQKWRRGESQHMESLMEYFSQKDGERQPWLALNEQVRSKIKDILKLDITRTSPFNETILEDIKFDTITSSLCLIAAALTIDDFKRVLQNIRELLQPGGRLVVIDVLDEKYYYVGDIKFKTLCSTEDEILDAYKECGYEVELWETKTFEVDTKDSKTEDGKTKPLVLDPAEGFSFTMYAAVFKTLSLT